MRKLFKKDSFLTLLIIAFSLLGTYHLLKGGFYSFSDEPHIANLYQMVRGLEAGFPPRWAPDVIFNFGYPLYNFYYHLPFYLGSALFLLGFSLMWSLKLVFLLSFPASGVAFYLLARSFFSRPASFAAAVLYLFTPYRAVDLYVRGAVGELWSFVFMPLVLLSFTKLTQKTSFKNLAFTAVAIAGLVLAHNLSAVVFLPFAFLFAIVLLLGKTDKARRFFSLISGVFLGAGLSAYHILPALFERGYIQPGTPFSPQDHFPFIKQLIYSPWGYGASVWGPNDDLSFQIGLVNLAAVFLGVLIGIVSWRKLEAQKRALLLFLVTSFLFAVFLMNIRSMFVWRLLPLSEYVQFPWRFLMLTTIFSSLLAGLAVDFLLRKQLQLVLALAILTVAINWSYFRPANVVYVDDNYYLERFFANRTVEGKRPSLSEKYLNYSEDYMTLTVWANKKPEFVPENKIESSEAKVSKLEEISPVHYTASVSSDKEAEVIVHNFYFPGWKAFIDGNEADIYSSGEHGEIAFRVPAGDHKISVKFSDTPVRRVSNAVSLATLLGLFSYPIIRRRARSL